MWFWRYLLETYCDFLRLVYLWEMLSEELKPMLADAFLFDRQLLHLRYEQEVFYQRRKSRGYGSIHPLSTLGVRS